MDPKASSESKQRQQPVNLWKIVLKIIVILDKVKKNQKHTTMKTGRIWKPRSKSKIQIRSINKIKSIKLLRQLQRMLKILN